MALVHQATLTPSKLDLLANWLPTRSWFRDGGELARIDVVRVIGTVLDGPNILTGSWDRHPAVTLAGVTLI
jgi:hypothetical protein